jgi:hypothetical protein
MSLGPLYGSSDARTILSHASGVVHPGGVGTAPEKYSNESTCHSFFIAPSATNRASKRIRHYSQPCQTRSSKIIDHCANGMRVKVLLKRQLNGPACPPLCSRDPPLSTPTRWQGSLQKAPTTFPTLTAACPLAQAKALSNSLSFRSRRLSAHNEWSTCCGGALPGPSTPSAPLAQGICFSRPAPSSERPQAGGERHRTPTVKKPSRKNMNPTRKPLEGECDG